MNNISTHNDSGRPQNAFAASFVSQSGPLLFLTLIFLLNFVARVIMAPLMPPIEKDLGLSHSVAGLFFLMIALGNFAGLLGSGFVSSRLNHKKTIVVSAIAIGVLLLCISFSSSAWEICLGLLFMGIAAGIYLPSGIATITDLISARHWGKAMAVHELAPNLGFVAAPLVSEALLVWVPWRGVLALLGGITILVAITFARFGRGGEFLGEAPSFGSFRTLVGEHTFWIMVVLFGLAMVASMGVYSMLPLYLVTDRGMDRSWANTILGVSRILGIGTAFLGGWASDRLGPRPTMAAVFLFTGTMTILLGALPSPWLTVIVFLQALALPAFFPPAFTALSLMVTPSLRNVIVSFTVPFASILGTGVTPAVIGIMGDAGLFSAAIVLSGALTCVGFVLSLYLRFDYQQEG